VARINKLVEKPFTNEIGQVINVGDKIAYVTHGTGRVGVGIGVYEGTNMGPQYYSGKDGDVDLSVRVGQIPVHSVFYKKNPAYNPRARWGTPEYVEYYLKNEDGNLVIEKEEHSFKKTTLPNMRIFKIDTAVADLKGKRI